MKAFYTHAGITDGGRSAADAGAYEYGIATTG